MSLSDSSTASKLSSFGGNGGNGRSKLRDRSMFSELFRFKNSLALVVASTGTVGSGFGVANECFLSGGVGGLSFSSYGITSSYSKFCKRNKVREENLVLDSNQF